MKKESIILNNEIAHYYYTDNDGVEAHFYPGNGLPNLVYQPFLNLLAEKFNISSLVHRASWENSKPQTKQVNWEMYADDLIAFLEQKYNTPVIGIGHSQGATATVIAATKRPDLFKGLYLIEPVSVTKLDELLVKIIPYFLKKKIEPFKSALKKKTNWKSPEDYSRFLQTNKGFKRIKEKELKIFAEESLKLKDNHYELIYPLDWEVANYALPINLNKYFNKLEVPFKIIAGKPSVFLNEKVRLKLKDLIKEDMVIDTNSGHLIPLEAPQFCAEQILK